MILGLYFFLFGLFLLFLYSVHYVYILLMIELVLLGSFVFLFFSFFGVLGLYMSFVFLLVVVCMGGFSISLLVSISRCYGRDFWFLKFLF
uniref:NADH dehydrogenase subunit 4L n=1 Tax=Oribatula sp. XFX TaxID=2652662 RepID=A0A5J6VD05_9ACAR|nr:NADH dehydrogenase subunit 4L [Oribatula sp. XFX]